MSYGRTTNIIVRPASQGAIESELGGILDSVTGFVKDVVNAYGDQKKAEGAAAVNTAGGAVMPGVSYPVDTGPSMGTIAVVAGIGIGAFLILRRKKH